MNVTSVMFDLYFKGQGIVNYNRAGKSSGLDHQFAKKVYVHEVEDYKPYVSRNCVLHEILEEPYGFKLLSQSPNDIDRLEVNLSKYRMLRGNLDATEKASVRRKSCFTFTDLMPTEECDTITVAHVSKGNMGGSFLRDSVLQTSFKATVAINLNDLQFISTESFSGMPNIIKDFFDKESKDHPAVLKIWEDNYPSTPFPEPKHYNVNGGAIQTEGFKLADRDVGDIVRWFVERICGFNLNKSGAYLKFSDIDNITLYTDMGPVKLDSLDALMSKLSSPSFTVRSTREEAGEIRDISHIIKKIEESKGDSKAKKKASKK